MFEKYKQNTYFNSYVYNTLKRVWIIILSNMFKVVPRPVIRVLQNTSGFIDAQKVTL